MTSLSKIWGYIASLVAVVAAADPALLVQVLGNQEVATRVIALCVLVAAWAHSLPGSGGGNGDGATTGLTKNIIAPHKD